ncbi:MAG: hypothetical protein N3A66_11730 [Planctomycetota bacterium]|nr:hypothetical protein [Planctomycetota bacterium]
MSTNETDSALQEMFGKVVVVDIAPPVIYIGTLRAADTAFLTLENADVHPLWNSSTSKEVYLMEARRNGVQPTRRRVLVKRSEVLSISLLEDVVLY